MKISGAIFDLDGTLLDSMHIWEDLGKRFLESIGISYDDKVSDAVRNMSLPQSAAYLKQTYSIDLEECEIISRINVLIESFYKNEAMLKDGVKAFLEYLKNINVRMCIATAADKSLAKAALERNGVDIFFDEIFTCSDIGYSKDNPLIFEKASEFLGCKRDEIFVFEDALYAGRVAKAAGFKLAGIFDSSEKNITEFKKVSDIFIYSYEQAKYIFSK